MECAACKKPLKDREALEVTGMDGGKISVFYVHRPDVDGRCFSKVVLANDTISLVVEGTYTPVPKSFPYTCPVCDEDNFYGKLLFDGDEVPTCPNPHYIEDQTVYPGTKPDAVGYEVRLVKVGDTMGHPNDVLTGNRVVPAT